MATGQVLFHRFFYSKSFVKHSFEVSLIEIGTIASQRLLVNVSLALRCGYVCGSHVADTLELHFLNKDNTPRVIIR